MAAAKRTAAPALATDRALAQRLGVFERELARAIRERAGGPGRLGAAVRYAALSPGKRLRPLLVLTACEAVGGDWKRAMPAAVAIECVHAFSLVHDDLPAMDDDDYRRGRLTTHKKFGEALGVLAGDALLSFAFEELTRLAEGGLPPARVIEAVRVLSRAAGANELVGGQALDIAAEGLKPTARIVRDIHVRKTGALMGAALALGALAGDAGARTVLKLQTAGTQMGFAFQIHDDLLNAGSSLKTLGKRAGTDAARGKATWPAAVGEKRAAAEAQRIMKSVEVAIARTCERPRLLMQLIEATAHRQR
jgi:geranylgeranyl diphosphate synthase type II